VERKAVDRRLFWGEKTTGRSSNGFSPGGKRWFSKKKIRSLESKRRRRLSENNGTDVRSKAKNRENGPGVAMPKNPKNWSKSGGTGLGEKASKEEKKIG